MYVKCNKWITETEQADHPSDPALEVSDLIKQIFEVKVHLGYSYMICLKCYCFFKNFLVFVFILSMCEVSPMQIHRHNF